MNTEQSKPTSEALQAGHDTTPVNVRAVALAGVGLVVMLILALLVAWWLTRAYSAQVPPVAVPFPPEQIEQEQPLLPQPRLQANPTQDWQEQQRQAREHLNSYHWIDRDQGIVRIPIERAIDLLAEEGLPVREQPAAAEDGGEEEE